MKKSPDARRCSSAEALGLFKKKTPARIVVSLGGFSLGHEYDLCEGILN